jgi:RNA polymerase sigma factor (TIGR02999 family)
MGGMSDITQLLGRAGAGEEAAANELLPLIYARLKELARRQLSREGDSPSLATTALVHDAYLSLFGEQGLQWRDRGHFFAYAARAMRSLLIDRARRRLSEKRGGGLHQVELSLQGVEQADECLDLLALDQALTTLADDHPRLVQVVELRFFAGLSVQETASGLGVDARTVERDWRKARAFIYDAMGRTP